MRRLGLGLWINTHGQGYFTLDLHGKKVGLIFTLMVILALRDKIVLASFQKRE